MKLLVIINLTLLASHAPTATTSCAPLCTIGTTVTVQCATGANIDAFGTSSYQSVCNADGTWDSNMNKMCAQANHKCLWLFNGFDDRRDWEIMHRGSDAFEQYANMPSGGFGNGYNAMNAHILDGHVIVFENFSPSPVYKIDIATKAVTTAAPLSSPFLRTGMASDTFNGYIVVCGGKIKGSSGIKGCTNNCYRYHPSTGAEWITSMMSVRNSPAACTFNGRLWLMGGLNAGVTPIRSVESLGTDGKWRIESNMVQQRYGLRCASYKGQLVVCGGYYGGSGYRTCEWYDPETNRWSLFKEASQLPNGQWHGAMVVLDNQLLYIQGLQSTNGWTEKSGVYVFNDTGTGDPAWVLLTNQFIDKQWSPAVVAIETPATTIMTATTTTTTTPTTTTTTTPTTTTTMTPTTSTTTTPPTTTTTPTPTTMLLRSGCVRPPLNVANDVGSITYTTSINNGFYKFGTTMTVQCATGANIDAFGTSSYQSVCNADGTWDSNVLNKMCAQAGHKSLWRFTGYDDDHYWEIMDRGSNAIAEYANMPRGRRGYARNAQILDGYVIVFNSKYLIFNSRPSVYKIDIATKVVTTAAPLYSPFLRTGMASDTFNGYIVVCGGDIKGASGYTKTKACYKYHPSIGPRSITSMMSVRYAAAACTFNGRLWVTGGFDGSRTAWARSAGMAKCRPGPGTSPKPLLALATVESLGTNWRWQRESAMVKQRAGHSCAVYKGQLVVCGGYYGSSYYRSCERYDPNTNRWSLFKTASYLPQPRRYGAMVVLDNQLHYMGNQYIYDSQSSCGGGWIAQRDVLVFNDTGNGDPAWALLSNQFTEEKWRPIVVAVET